MSSGKAALRDRIIGSAFSSANCRYISSIRVFKASSKKVRLLCLYKDKEGLLRVTQIPITEKKNGDPDDVSSTEVTGALPGAIRKGRKVSSIETIEGGNSETSCALDFVFRTSGSALSVGDDERFWKFVALSTAERGSFVASVFQNCESPPDLRNISLAAGASGAASAGTADPQIAAAADQTTGSNSTQQQQGQQQQQQQQGQTAAKKVIGSTVLSAEEEKSLGGMLTMYDDLDPLSPKDTDAFIDRLRFELSSLEKANIHSMLSSGLAIHGIVERLDASLVMLDDMAAFLDLYAVRLKVIQQDMSLVEARNNKMEQRTRNHQKLAETLHWLLETYDLPASTERVLRSAGKTFDDLDTMSDILQRTAISQLTNALDTVMRPSLSGASDPMRTQQWQKMAAVQARLREFRALRNLVVQGLHSYLIRKLQLEVDSMLQDKSRYAKKGDVRLSSHAPFFAKLTSLQSLVKRCFVPPNAPVPSEDVDAVKFDVVAHYAVPMRAVHQKEIHAFLQELRPRIIRSGSSDQAFVIFASSGSGSIAGGGSTNVGRSVAGSVANGVGGPGGAGQPDLRPDEAFKIAMDRILGAMNAEYDFCLSFFGYVPIVAAVPAAVSSASSRSLTSAAVSGKRAAPPPSAALVDDAFSLDDVEFIDDDDEPPTAAADIASSDEEKQQSVGGSASIQKARSASHLPPKGRQSAPKPNYELDSVVEVMMLETVRSEVVEFAAEWLDKRINRFFYLLMLDYLERRITEYTDNGRSAILRPLAESQIKIKERFNSFMDKQFQAIRDFKSQIKRIGVLPFFTRFPLFLDYILSNFSQIATTGVAGNASIEVLVKSIIVLFEKMEHLAQTDAKYADVLRLENCWFFSNSLMPAIQARKLPAALQKWVRESKVVYEKARTAVIIGNVRHRFKDLVEFFDSGIERLVQQGLPSNEVQFQQEFSKQKFKHLIAKEITAETIRKGIMDIQQRLVKHLSSASVPELGEGQKAMLLDVWKKFVQYFSEIYFRWEQRAKECYENEKLPLSSSEVTAILRQVLAP